VRRLAFAMLATGLLTVLTACGTGEEVVFVGSNATGEQASAEISRETVEKTFRGAGKSTLPGEWQIVLATRISPNARFVVTELVKDDGEHWILAGVVKEPAERGGPIAISKPKAALEETFDMSGAPVFTMTFMKTKPYPSRGRVQLVLGWVNDPRVDSFTLEFSNGLRSELNAATHPYFMAVLDEPRGSWYNLEEIIVVDIIAKDANGEIIE